MQLHQLEYFVVIADCKSMNKAAEKLFVTQSNLSKAMKNLEEELGYPVLKRSRHGVTMTEMGEKLYSHAKVILEQKGIIDSLSQESLSRTLSIVSYPFFSVPRLLGELYSQSSGHNNISYHLVECRIKEVIERVENGAADIGVLVYNSEQCRTLKHQLKQKKLQLTQLFQDSWYVNVGPKSPLYNRDSVELHELLSYAPVRMPDDCFSNLTSCVEIDGVKFHQIKNTVFVNGCGAMISFLQDTTVFRLGPGVSRMDLERFGIRSIPIQNCQIEIYVGWICKEEKALSADERAFIHKLEQLKK